MNVSDPMRVIPAGVVQRSHDEYEGWCRRKESPWPVVLVKSFEGYRSDGTLMYTVCRLYEWRRSGPCRDKGVTA